MLTWSLGCTSAPPRVVLARMAAGAPGPLRLGRLVGDALRMVDPSVGEVLDRL
jgi:hypothetical protein